MSETKSQELEKELIENIEKSDYNTLNEAFNDYEKAINTYLQKMAQAELLDFSSQHPIKDAVSPVIGQLDIAHSFYSETGPTSYSVEENGKTEDDIAMSFTVSFEETDEYDIPSDNWLDTTFSLDLKTLMILSEAKQKYMQEQMHTEKIDIEDEIETVSLKRGLSADEVFGTAAFYLKGNAELPLIFDDRELEDFEFFEDCASEIIDAFEEMKAEGRWPKSENGRLDAITSPMGKMVQLLENAGYNVETEIDDDMTKASMIVTRQYKDAGLQINITDIDLTEDKCQAKNQLIINGTLITDENRAMFNDCDKIFNNAKQVMEMVNSPDRNINMLKDIDVQEH